MSDRSSQKSSGVTPGRILAGVLVALVVVFCVLNSQSVRMHWLLATTTTPLFVIIAVFSLIGGLVGFIAGRRNRSR